MYKDNPDLSAPAFKRPVQAGNRAYFTELHHWNSVNIIYAFLSHGDIPIVVNEASGHATFGALRS
jgi:hypothetical protein